MAGLLDKHMVFVTGKGGVGKTTVAAALGLAAARAGLRTLVAEVAEQQQIASLFAVAAAPFTEVEVAPGLSTISIDPEHARAEWLRYQLRSGALAGLLDRSRIFTYLAAAAPGLAELVTIGKVWELAQIERRSGSERTYDFVVVDAPATGHGIALLRSPRTFADIAKVGPIRRQAGIIDAFLRDPALTGVIAVALPEEMPVNETLEFESRLAAAMDMTVDRVLVNAVLPQRFSGPEAQRLGDALLAAERDAAEAIEVALTAHAHGREQRSQLARLRRGSDAPVGTLPHLLVPEVEREDLERLSHELERSL